MSQDIIADALNEIMNTKRARRDSVTVDRHSKVLIKVLELAQKEGYINSFEVKGTKLDIKIGELNECKVIKPRFYVTVDKIDKYMRRYLPAKDMGIMIISTNKGMMTHEDALTQEIGGALIAYFY